MKYNKFHNGQKMYSSLLLLFVHMIYYCIKEFSVFIIN